MIHIAGRLVFDACLILGGALVLLSFSHLYHAIRFGGRDPLAIATTGVFIAGIIAIIWMTLSLTSTVNWSRSFDIGAPNIHFGLPPN